MLDANLALQIQGHQHLQKKLSNTTSSASTPSNAATTAIATTDDNESTGQNVATFAGVISFADPRQGFVKKYEIYLRQKRPKQIAKCRGQCGKPLSNPLAQIFGQINPVVWRDQGIAHNTFTSKFL